MKISSGLVFSILLMMSVTNSIAQDKEPPFIRYMNHPWVDSIMKTLSTEEKIGQLIWVAAFSDRDISYDVELSNTLKDYSLGGVIFFEGNSRKQAEMINSFRKTGRVPPIVAIDGEWGIGMRNQEIGSFPYQMTLGAIKDKSLIYKMGEAVAAQMKRAGININLAPVADVNNNPLNPVINYRSFGEDPLEVALKVDEYARALQDNGIMAVAKHFPGHGDTRVDSHVELPVIHHNRELLNTIDLVPFRKLIGEGISGVMPGHLSIPAIDGFEGQPTTISAPVVTGLLRNELGFRGLIFSDAMNMGGLTTNAGPGDSEVLALKAGIDVLEYVVDVKSAVKAITRAIQNGTLKMADIDLKCRKVLAAKYWSGLSKPTVVSTDNIEGDLFPPAYSALNRSLYSSALTLLRNEGNIIPIKNLDRIKIASVAVNSSGETMFQRRLASYTSVDNYTIDNFSDENIASLLDKLKTYDLVISGIYGMGWRSMGNVANVSTVDSFCARLGAQNKVIISYFGNAYSLGRRMTLHNSSALLLAYQENELAEDVAAQMFFGAVGASGVLPVTISDDFPIGSGITTRGDLRVKFAIPESAGVSSLRLQSSIDSLALNGINAGAYPGCEIMVARQGTVIFHKTYGYQTYDNRTPVAPEDLYDLASVTKISATMAGLCLLGSSGVFSPDHDLQYYLPYFAGSNKATMNIRDMLAHQAGLTAWIPFWKQTVKKNGDFRRNTFSPVMSEKYPLKVAQGLYMYKNYRDRIFREIKKSPVSTEKKYLYSDLTFIIMPEIINKLSGKTWYDFVTDSVYRKIGAWDICFNPYLKYPLSRIVPTEYDSLFRKQQLHGTVHDEGAAMLGGISGHAGLFATANDLMKLMELYRRMGNYGGEQIFNQELMKEYTSYQFPGNKNRRGVGFDKPSVDRDQLKKENVYPTYGASPSSFGHSGYTGTFVWMDPENEITYIFLCNRVYPTRENNKLSDMNIRTNILQAIYDSIEK
ncbi:MAG: glycoside hydrolase family 3 N-terminal domain-containing protein [Bacteroidales bacterium]